jgi:metal-responsive CopG/Arc/MetJ family transcriptional regulator
MKAAISLPDEILIATDRLAKTLRMSRSGLVQKALVEYLQRHDPDEITSRLDAALDRLEPQDRGLEPGQCASTIEALSKVEWEW